MEITRKVRHLVKHPLEAGETDNDIFLPQSVFRRIINREKDRANRTGEIFTLVVFLLPDKKRNPKTHALLTEKLPLSVRSIDAIGWLDQQHIGILLPETDSAGAHKFLNKLNTLIQPEELPPDCEIFTYPSERLTDPEKVSRQHENEEVEIKWRFGAVHRTGICSSSEISPDYIFCLTKRIVKRCLDIFGASICLIIFSPLLVAIAVFIKIVSPGPVFFKQQRIGYAGQPFTFLKFRTMRLGGDTQTHQEYLAQLIKGGDSEGEEDTPMTKMDHDPRIIPFGNLLRKSCLDELPQLINVLKGDMSLVGPRPPIPYEVKEYLSWHWGRFNALPGMTGLWQVSGKNKLSFREMVRLDICYTRKRSIWMDIIILFKTPLAILEQLKESLNKDDPTNEGTTA